jgi:hypothetical protein
VTTPPEHHPHFGFTKRGLAVHQRTVDHLPHKHAIDRFNSWLAIKITNAVGSMWCAYLFAAIAIYGLPAALKPGGEGIVSWTAQTFLQLVLLSIILVGGNTQAQASDARASKTFEDTELLVDRLDTSTEGGIAVLDRKLDKLIAGLYTENEDNKEHDCRDNV